MTTSWIWTRESPPRGPSPARMTHLAWAVLSILMLRDSSAKCGIPFKTTVAASSSHHPSLGSAWQRNRRQPTCHRYLRGKRPRRLHRITTRHYTQSFPSWIGRCLHKTLNDSTSAAPSSMSAKLGSRCTLRCSPSGPCSRLRISQTRQICGQKAVSFWRGPCRTSIRGRKSRRLRVATPHS